MYRDGEKSCGTVIGGMHHRWGEMNSFNLDEEMRMDIKSINRDNYTSVLKNGGVVVYGAGRTGDALCECLKDDLGYQILFMIDDDPNKWGTNHAYGYRIEPFSSFIEYMDKADGEISLLITTMYGGQVIKKLKDEISDIDKIRLYDAIDFRNGDFKLIEQVKSDYRNHREEWCTQLEANMKVFADNESKQVLRGIKGYLETDNRGILKEICSAEEFYFIYEVIKALPKEPVIVDGGAYIGDLYRQIRDLEITVKRWYCFELDAVNYNKIRENFSDLSIREKMVIENCGLSDVTGELFEERDGICSYIVDYETSYRVSVWAMDDYFKSNEKVDYIKLDIEGSEWEALHGGIRTIKKNRPIMAICVYHKLFDYVRIPRYLHDELDGYTFFIRQHQWTLGKTILYCIPNEEMK